MFGVAPGPQGSAESTIKHASINGGYGVGYPSRQQLLDNPGAVYAYWHKDGKKFHCWSQAKKQGSHYGVVIGHDRAHALRLQGLGTAHCASLAAAWERLVIEAQPREVRAYGAACLRNEVARTYRCEPTYRYLAPARRPSCCGVECIVS